MRKFIITITLLLFAVFLYLLLAVEHDKKWFQNFSKSSSSDSRNTNQNASEIEINDNDHLFLGEKHAKIQIQKFVTDTKQFTWDTIIKDKKTGDSLCYAFIE
ncbi:MAG: hypothetical protein ACOVP7_03625, partial [Lacibacter sp.]